MVEIISEGMRADVIALAAHGKVDHEDYRKVVIPAVEKKLKAYPKIRLFYHLGQDFDAYSIAALWDDTVLGVRHWTGFEKVAIVTDVEWVKKSAAFFRFLFPCPVRLFPNGEFDAAAGWINA